MEIQKIDVFKIISNFPHKNICMFWLFCTNCQICTYKLHLVCEVVNPSGGILFFSQLPECVCTAISE